MDPAPDEGICYLTTTIPSILISPISFDGISSGYSYSTITNPQLMINKDDRIISMLLYNSTESDMTYQRPDMTTYICQIRKNKPDTFRIPETQLSLPL